METGGAVHAQTGSPPESGRTSSATMCTPEVDDGASASCRCRRTGVDAPDPRSDVRGAGWRLLREVGEQAIMFVAYV